MTHNKSSISLTTPSVAKSTTEVEEVEVEEEAVVVVVVEAVQDLLPNLSQPASQGQAPVPVAADVRTMGEKPAIFTGNRTKADDFIEEVKAYFCVNQDITGFNSPIKKVAFTLTLIKGDEVAGWVKDMGT